MGEPTKAPAGWYDDGAGSLRYWDGDSWTEHTSAVATTAAPDESPAEVRRSAAYGIGALTSALVGFVLTRLPFEIPALVGVVLLLVGLVIAIIAIVIVGREWRVVTALVVSIIGLVTSLIGVVIGAVSVIPSMLDEMGRGVPTTGPTAHGGAGSRTDRRARRDRGSGQG